MARTPRPRAVVYPARIAGNPIQASTGLLTPIEFAGLSRVDESDSRCQVGAEWIAANLAWAVGLPVPPGGLVRMGGQLAYARFRFGEGGNSPPVDCAEFANRHPREAAGAVVFDLWIANPDRTDFNLAEDGPGRAPVLFDHEMALGGGWRSELLALPSRAHEVFDDHDCDLNDALTRSDHLGVWVDRVCALDRVQITRPCDELVSARYWSTREGGSVRDFLLERRKHLWDLLKQTCPNVENWTL